MNLGSGGSAYNAVMYNSPTVSVTDQVVGSAAVEFDSALCQYIQIPSFRTASSGISVACWFKSTSSGDSSQIFEFSAGYTDDVIVGYPNDIISFSVSFNDGVVEATVEASIESDSNLFGINLNDGVWRHFAWTIDIGGDWLLYLNGKLVHSLTSYGYPLSVNRTSNYLGTSGIAFSDSCLDGAIDEFYFFQNVIPASTVQALYAQALTAPTSSPSMIMSKRLLSSYCCFLVLTNSLKLFIIKALIRL